MYIIQYRDPSCVCVCVFVARVKDVSRVQYGGKIKPALSIGTLNFAVLQAKSYGVCVVHAYHLPILSSPVTHMRTDAT